MESISDRMQQIVDAKFSGNKAAFARAIGLAETSISNYLSKARKSEPGGKIIAQIVETTEVDARWLLTGEGEMNMYTKADLNVKVLSLCRELLELYSKSEVISARLKILTENLK